MNSNNLNSDNKVYKNTISLESINSKPKSLRNNKIYNLTDVYENNDNTFKENIYYSYKTMNYNSLKKNNQNYSVNKNNNLFLQDSSKRKLYDNKKTRNETENSLKILSPFLQQNQKIRTQLYQNVNFNKHFIEEKPIKNRNFSQEQILYNQNINDENFKEKIKENKGMKQNKKIQSVNKEKYSSLSSDNLSEKEKDLKFHVKLSKVQKEYIDLKGKIDLLKKKKDYIQKQIKETEENNKKNIIKLKTQKINSINNISNKENNINSEEESKKKKTAKEIYEDYKEKEEEILREARKHKDYPEIDPRNDKFGMFVDNLIKNAFNRYKNKDCINCCDLLSKGISTEKCPRRQHLFKKELE